MEEGWYIIEMLGHRRLAGIVREEEIAGVGVLRIDVPGDVDEAPFTHYVAPAALYALTPTTEAVALAVARRNRPAPVQRWELVRLPEPGARDDPFTEVEIDEDEPEE